MNLVCGEIVDVFPGPEPVLGKIRVNGAIRKISLDLLTNPSPGDKVIVFRHPEFLLLRQTLPEREKTWRRRSLHRPGSPDHPRACAGLTRWYKFTKSPKRRSSLARDR